MAKITLISFMFFLTCFMVENTKAADACLDEFKTCSIAFAKLDELPTPKPNACQKCFHTCGGCINKCSTAKNSLVLSTCELISKNCYELCSNSASLKKELHNKE